VDACRMALMYEFVRDLPDGYDKLGKGGALRDSSTAAEALTLVYEILGSYVFFLPQLVPAHPLYPTDEATSALDATSPLLVFEAIKRWTNGKTTIVVTHDLSQISSSDFTYVIKSG
jgi:ATP-binding cassette, subfamily B (MDR/TAP), member 1